MTLAPGSTLGPYTVTAELGHGGMGVVYTAHDPRLKRRVAIKFLSPELTRDDTAKQRFLQEAQAASALDHQNICTIFEINETADGQLYLVMAYYEGETLKERIDRGTLTVDEAVDFATQVGRGLAEAHGAGIVHRDIKPANLMIAKGCVVKILDFGLAKLAGAEGVTQTGTTVGTVAYMSPEQARGQEVDYRTDIWSLGVVLYEMLTGQQPFQGGNLLDIANAIRVEDPPSLADRSAPLDRIVRRALEKDRAQRHESVQDLTDQLRRVSSGTSTPTEAGVERVRGARQTEIVFVSSAIQHLLDQVRAVAGTDAPVLIQGESGVGKELVARHIHEESERRDGPFVKVDCAAIPPESFERDFFGCVSNDATARDEPGRLEGAKGGTLFLDHVAELPDALQAKLLRPLQDSVFERVGDSRTRRADVRYIAATNRDLSEQVSQGHFRQDHCCPK